MSDSVAQQLTAIHSMLSAGHRNLRIERHTLVLWGLAGGGLLTASPWILTEAQLPALEQRAVAWLTLLTIVLGAVAALDWHLTRRAKRVRDEAWSFIHRQVLKVWWLLMGLGTLLTFAMFFFGGGYMVCAAWMVLIGLGLYVHGLFSEELLEWVGVLAIVIGIASLGYRLEYETTRQIAASLFGLGLPLLALMLDRGRARSSWHRMAQSAAWVLVVLGVPLTVHLHGVPVAPQDAPPVALDAFRRGAASAGRHTVVIPAGTPIPVEIDVTGSIFRNAPVTLPLTLAAPLEVLVEDGRPTGPVRIRNQAWAEAGAVGWIRIPTIRADLTAAQGPSVRATLDVTTMAEQRR